MDSIAETVVGRGNRAWQVYTRTCPAYIEDISEIHRTEPYVYSQMIAGKDAPNFGEAKNSWLTGTAAWTFLDVSQYILGIRPDYDRIDRRSMYSIHSGWFRSKKRDFRGVTYHISVRNPKHVEKGVASMTVDGIAVERKYDSITNRQDRSLCRSGYGLILNHSNSCFRFCAGSSFTIFHYFPTPKKGAHYAHPLLFMMILFMMNRFFSPI